MEVQSCVLLNFQGITLSELLHVPERVTFFKYLTTFFSKTSLAHSAVAYTRFREFIISDSLNTICLRNHFYDLDKVYSLYYE